MLPVVYPPKNIILLFVSSYPTARSEPSPRGGGGPSVGASWSHSEPCAALSCTAMAIKNASTLKSAARLRGLLNCIGGFDGFGPIAKPLGGGVMCPGGADGLSSAGTERLEPPLTRKRKTLFASDPPGNAPGGC